MALVMLPCDLPWWSVVQKKLNFIQESTNLDEILEHMQKLHDLCNVSLDPEEDKRDSTILNGLRNFLENDLDNSERDTFITKTINFIAKRAYDLRSYRPPRGLEFSLQQHTDAIELNYKLVASLIANAFFSTFPKRTNKTHPTLQDFNFTNFFGGLETNSQKAKLKSLLNYFEWLETVDGTAEGCIKISRKVMNGKQWLTIEDWLECGLPLCSLESKHEGRIENASLDVFQNVFASAKLGGDVLYNGNSQECIQFCTAPEILVTLLYMEALEDNEAILIEGVRQISRIVDPKRKTIYERLEKPRKINLCCMDAENYSEYPINQFEEDNVLRELNKCLLGYRQNTKLNLLVEHNRDKRLKEKSRQEQHPHHQSKRLSPIGESGTNSPHDDFDNDVKIFIKQASTSTKRSSITSLKLEEDINKRRTWLMPNSDLSPNGPDGSIVSGPIAGRRGRFIVLGSSGECLPVNRPSSGSLYSSCNSSTEEFHSAQGSFEDEDENGNKNKCSDSGEVEKYTNELDTTEQRNTFAQKLREALQSEESLSDSSTGDSYAVGISVTGSHAQDPEIRLRRGGSRGFVLTEDSLDEEFYKDSLLHEAEWLNKFRNKQNGPLQRKDTDSSKYSNDTDYSSELEEVYEQFSKWLDDPILSNKTDKLRELDPRDEAVLRFANSLLKRTLSESFVGVPLTEGCISSTGISAEGSSMDSYQKKKNKPILNPRSLSLELAKHKHRLAAQLKRIQLKVEENESDLNDMKMFLRSDYDKLKKCDMNNNGNSSGSDGDGGEGIMMMMGKGTKNKSPKPIKKRWSISCISSEQNVNCDEVTIKMEQKISQITQKRVGNSDLSPIATGNWGCGRKLRGDVQLKLVIQWMAASVAGLPVLIYYTSGAEKLSKLDTICRVLLDREWTVGELASATLLHAKDVLQNPYDASCDCFFEKLIGLA